MGFFFFFFPHECEWRCLCKRSGSGHPGPDLRVNMRGHHTSCQSTSPNRIATPHVWEWTVFIAGRLQLSYICRSWSFLSISLDTPTLFLYSSHNAAQSSLSLEHPTHPPSFPPRLVMPCLWACLQSPSFTCQKGRNLAYRDCLHILKKADRQRKAVCFSRLKAVCFLTWWQVGKHLLYANLFSSLRSDNYA